MKPFLYKVRCFFTGDCPENPSKTPTPWFRYDRDRDKSGHWWTDDEDTKAGMYDFHDWIMGVEVCQACKKTRTIRY